eukprot:TRINITY_DN35009_c0_g1_i1.p1 TRINITY_DN35009_c0_g1~~TRINITY_DN35009_c0_g1_i1.p1  ORF type:complete len:324 (-),score=56.34 TRINITY_DN35009_c0_g1_i1:80-1051(-)
MFSSLPLPHGNMPTVGYGLWKVGKDKASSLVKSVIGSGYRHVDSAANYGNEKEVGEGIAKAIEDGICRREDLFITSKLWNTYHDPEHVEDACKRSLADLGLDYLDLYLIHFPISLKYVPFDVRYPPGWVPDPDISDSMEFAPVPISETWKAMEKLVDKGLVRNIGLSNWSSQGLRDIFSFARIKPAVLQIEIHPYLQNTRLILFAHSLGMVVTAFSPLGQGQSYVKLGHGDISALKDDVVVNMAERLGVSCAQVVLRWGIQRGCSVIPKSEHEGRVKENLDLFGFSLSQQDMDEIAGMDQNLRMNDPGYFCPRNFNTQCPIWD